MHRKIVQYLFILFTISTQVSLGQDGNKLGKLAKMDTLDVETARYLPAFTFNLKTQFPVQHAIGLEFSTPAMISGYIGIGQLSRAYVVTATEFLPARDENEEVRKQFIEDKLKNGFVFEIGAHYHFMKWKDVYVGLNLQFQRFSMESTAQELVEEYDFGDSQGFGDDIEELLEGNDLVREFYEETQIKAVVKPIQMGITVGKRFQFKKAPRLSLHTEFSYQLNLSGRSDLESDSFLGQVILNNFAGPVLSEGTAESFGSFNLPALTVRLSYALGEFAYKK